MVQNQAILTNMFQGLNTKLIRLKFSTTLISDPGHPQNNVKRNT